MRDDKGRYPKGHSGNRRGHPPKEKRSFTKRQLREDILLTMEEELTVPIDGKATKIPAIVLIHKQLVRKAANGDVRCMLEVIELRREIMAEMVKERGEMTEELIATEKAVNENPEDATDLLLHAMQKIRDILNDEYTIR